MFFRIHEDVVKTIAICAISAVCIDYIGFTSVCGVHAMPGWLLLVLHASARTAWIVDLFGKSADAVCIAGPRRWR